MSPVENWLIEAWIWSCETGLIWAPAIAAGTWLTYRAICALADRITRKPLPAWDWLEPADADEIAINAHQQATDLAALNNIDPPAIDTQPAPEDDLSRALDALYHADAVQARKENEQ